MALRDIVRSTQVRAAAISARAADRELFPEYGVVSMYGRLDVVSKSRKPASEQLPTNPLVFGPSFTIASRLGALPIKVYEIDAEDGVRKEKREHPGYQLLRRPNPVLTRSLMVSNLVIHLLGYGKGAWLKVRDPISKEPVELWPIHPATLTVNVHPKKLVESFQVTINGAKSPPIDPGDVCYFRLMLDLDNPAEGFAPLGPLSTMAGMGHTAIERGEKMFDKALLARQWIEATRDVTNKAFRRLRAQMQGVRDDPYSIPILEEGMKMHDLEAPSAEVVMEAIKVTLSLVRDTLGFPEDGDPKKFTQDAIQPVADAIEQELERSLFSEWPDEPAFPEFAFRDQLRGDPLQRAQLHKERIYSMQETPDEARADENLPPLPNGAGAHPWAPLNLSPVDVLLDSDGSPEPRDTQGGLGGSEGKGTLVAASARLVARARKGYATLRERTIKRNAEQLARKLRGVLNKEAKAVKSAISGGRQARAAEFPSGDELRDIVGRSDKQIAQLLDQYMREAGDASAPGAADLIGHELTDGALDRLGEVYEARAEAVAERFAGVRGDRILGLVESAVESGTTARDLAAQIGDAYANLSTAYTDGLARTEIAFAYEQAAMASWADAGVEQIEVVDGGGPCTTGVCGDNAAGSPYRMGEEVGNVGYSFEGADAPPFHPGCTCFVVPFIEGARAAEQVVPVSANGTTIHLHIDGQRGAADVVATELERDAEGAITRVIRHEGQRRSVQKVERDARGQIAGLVPEEED